MNDRSWLVILVFGIWLFLSCFLGNLISVLNGIDSITIHRFSLFWVSFFSLTVVMIAVLSAFPDSLCSVLYFPKVVSHFISVVWFVLFSRILSMHVLHLVPLTYPSQCHFLLVITLTFPGHCLTSQARILLSCVSGHVPSTLKNTWHVLYVQ